MKAIEEYTEFLAQVRKETGIESLVPDDGGLVSVHVEDRFNVNFQFVEATGKVLCFVEVAQLPADENKRAEVTEILDDLFEGIVSSTAHLEGELSHRLGGELMID